jgi:hypothetical protein
VRDELPPAGPPDPEPGPEPTGRVEPTGPGPLVVLGLIGLFAGWAVRGAAIRHGSPTPMIPWLAVGVTWFLVSVTAGTAYLTWRTVQRDRGLLSPQQGLTRLVLGKTMDRLAALALGGYLGAAVSVLGVDGESADRMIVRAIVGAVGAALGLAAGLALEHACRVPPADR